MSTFTYGRATVRDGRGKERTMRILTSGRRPWLDRDHGLGTSVADPKPWPRSTAATSRRRPEQDHKHGRHRYGSDAHEGRSQPARL
jgi:hypothetical protein